MINFEKVSNNQDMAQLVSNGYHLNMAEFRIPKGVANFCSLEKFYCFFVLLSSY